LRISCFNKKNFPDAGENILCVIKEWYRKICLIVSRVVCKCFYYLLSFNEEEHIITPALIFDVFLETSQAI
jgi:hypothetical protein